MDPESAAPRFVHLATMGDLMAARTTAARLESDGIEVRVHGEALGPYRLTVGDLAVTELWVVSDRFEEARRIMLAAEVDGVIRSVEESAESESPAGILMLIALVLLAVVAVRLAVLVF